MKSTTTTSPLPNLPKKRTPLHQHKATSTSSLFENPHDIWTNSLRTNKNYTAHNNSRSLISHRGGLHDKKETKKTVNNSVPDFARGVEIGLMTAKELRDLPRSR